MKKATLKKVMAAVGMMAVLSVPSVSHAQWAVSDSGAYEWLKKIIQGNELTAKAVDAAQEQREEARYQQDVQREIQRRNIESAVSLQPTGRACAERTSSRVAGVGRAGGGRSAAAIAKSVNDSREFTANPTDALEQALNVKNKDTDLCTSSDARLADKRRLACSGEGLKADAQRKAGSVFAAAGTGSTVVLDAAGRPRNATMAEASYSMDAKDQLIASSAIKNIVTALPPTALPPEAEATGSGRAYRGLQEKYEARMSTATEALSHMASKNFIPDPSTLTADQRNAWLKQETKFRELYGNRRDWAKAGPSQNEAMNLLVFGTDTDTYKKSLLVPSDDLLRALINSVNIGNQLQLTAVRQSERATAVQAALLAQQLEPITSQTLEATRNEALTKARR